MGPRPPLLWVLRIGASLASIGLAAILVWACLRRSLVPDFLRQLRSTLLERDGVCFAVAPAIRGGLAYLHVAFENRYAAPCDFRVAIAGPPKFFQFNQQHFPGIDVVVECQGGMLGLIRAPIGVPVRFQGKRIKFRVTAETHYTGRRGMLLRFRGGTAVPATEQRQLGPVVFWLLSLVTGQIHFWIHAKKAAALPLTFLDPVAEEVPAEAEPTVETLWLPGDPVNGVVERLKQFMAVR